MRFRVKDPIEIEYANDRDLPVGTQLRVQATLTVASFSRPTGEWVIPAGLDPESLRAVSVVMGMPTYGVVRLDEVRVMHPLTWWGSWWDRAMGRAS